MTVPVHTSSTPVPTPPPVPRPPALRSVVTIQDRSRELLVWDAPNVDMTLTNVIGGRPGNSTRPRFEAVARWFLQTSDPESIAEAAVFCNVQGETDVTKKRRWIESIRGVGYDVFAKPKVRADSDVDEDMLGYIAERTPMLRRVIVVSGDGKCFLGPLEKLAGDGVQVLVASFAEVAGWACESAAIRFVDMEDIPGAFYAELPRMRLEKLPPEGAWLMATKRLRELPAGLEDPAPLIESPDRV